MRPGPICKRLCCSPQFPILRSQPDKASPALGLPTLQGADVILSQITSQARSDIYSVTLDGADFTAGGLNQSSRIRPNRLFTPDDNRGTH